MNYQNWRRSTEETRSFRIVAEVGTTNSTWCHSYNHRCCRVRKFFKRSEKFLRLQNPDVAELISDKLCYVWNKFVAICCIFHALPPTTIERRVLTVDNEGNVVSEKRNGGESRKAHRRVAKQISRRTQSRAQVQRSSRPPQQLLLRRPLARIEPHMPIPPRSPPRVDDISRRTWTRTRVLSQRPNSVNFPLSRSSRVRPPLTSFTRAPLRFPSTHSTRRIVDNTMRAITIPLPIEPPRWTSRPVVRLSRPPTNNILTARKRILPRPRIGNDGAILAQRPFEPSEADIEQAVINAILESSTIATRRRSRLRRPNLHPTSPLPSTAEFPNTRATQTVFATPLVSNTAQREDHSTRPLGFSFTTTDPRFTGTRSEDNIEAEAIIPVITTTPMTNVHLERTLTTSSSFPTSSGRRISLVFGREQSRQRSRSRGLHKHSSLSSSLSHTGSATVDSTVFTTETPSTNPFFRTLSTSVKPSPTTIVAQQEGGTPRLALISPFPIAEETSRTAFTEVTSPATLASEFGDLQLLKTTSSSSVLSDSEELQSSTLSSATLSSTSTILTTQTPTTEATSSRTTEQVVPPDGQNILKEKELTLGSSEGPLRPDGRSEEDSSEEISATTASVEQLRGPPVPPSTVNPQADNQTTVGELKDELNKNIIEGEQLTVLPPSPVPTTTTPSMQEIGAPGAEPPNDSVVAELNNADNFMEVARRLQLLRNNFARDRNRRWVEDPFTDHSQSQPQT